MQSVFRGEGLLQKYFDGYESREEQIQMAEFVEEVCFTKKNGIMEAGTGTGKSLSYVIPLAGYSLYEKKRVAVSTETRALQRQLIDGDIPLAVRILQDSMDRDLKWELCLGGNNYPCRLRWELLRKSGRENREIMDMLEKAFQQKNVITRFDLDVSETSWNRINRQYDMCQGNRCPWFGGCSFQLARKRWFDADLLVMNHYLYFSGYAGIRRILPHIDVMIFDEAHSLEDICSRQLGLHLEAIELREILHVIEGSSTRFQVALLFPSKEKEEIEQLSREVWKSSHRFFENLGSMIPSGSSSLTLRSPLNPEEDIIGVLKRLLDAVNSRLNDYDSHESINIILERVSNGLYQWFTGLRRFIRQEMEGYVYWVERTGSDLFAGIACHAQPVDVSGLMKREVMDDHSSVLFVSATLSVSNRFTFIERRLGIENHDILSVPSPFNYQEQTLLYIPENMPDPDEDEYMERSLQEISGIVEILDGNCLLLFTSHISLKAFADALKERTERPVVAQGEMEASGAIERFRSLSGGLLLGTHAMWQGIDLPGDQLRGVIIMRFPFEVPDNPVHQARMERLEKMGLNPFLSYAMPQAVIRLKQGFGRLIRGKSDRGIVAIMDSRIVNRRYGTHFMKSIPESPLLKNISCLRERYREMAMPE